MPYVVPSRLRSFAFALVLAPAAASLVACSGATERPPTSANGASKAPIGENTHGAVRLVGAALSEVSLRPEQRTKLEAIVNEAEARQQAKAGARKELVAALADQVEAGTIDRAALTPKLDALKGGADDAPTLERVHAVLDRQQRAEFVDALEDEIRDTMRGHRRGKRSGHAKAAPMAQMKQLAARLELTDAQRDQIKEKLKALRASHAKDHEGRRGGKGGKGGFHPGKAKRALESFKSDDFKAASLAGAFGGPGGRGAHAERMIEVAEAVLPILTPAQRKIAADELRRFAARGEMPGER